MLSADWEIERYSEPLDLLSTSASLALVQKSFVRCEYGAPFFAYCKGGGRYAVVQGCCNHWECVRCGEIVAKKHYGRIVEGAREIATENPLYFITITCRGLELSVQEAMAGYGAWSHRLLETCRQKCIRSGGKWFYAQVTEAQKRGHPHSHILCSFKPHDLVDGVKEKWTTGSSSERYVEYVDALRSDWLQEMVQRAGLGEQYDISQVRTVEAASRYVAKYMFKHSQFRADFPKRWKRVRYSNSWPKLKQKKTDAFVLLERRSWLHLAQIAAIVEAEAGEALDVTEFNLSGTGCLVREKRNERNDRERI